MIKIKPCYSCGECALATPLGQRPYKWQVQCEVAECGVSGPIGDTALMAVTRWNMIYTNCVDDLAKFTLTALNDDKICIEACVTHFKEEMQKRGFV